MSLNAAFYRELLPPLPQECPTGHSAEAPRCSGISRIVPVRPALHTESTRDHSRTRVPPRECLARTPWAGAPRGIVARPLGRWQPRGVGGGAPVLPSKAPGLAESVWFLRPSWARPQRPGLSVKQQWWTRFAPRAGVSGNSRHSPPSTARIAACSSMASRIAAWLALVGVALAASGCRPCARLV